jgi:pimeloyl-ACP methyl ester carboxylesterase/DNA-binding CsgD family transcriptional regulator
MTSTPTQLEARIEVRQHIDFVRVDGARVAYATMGAGPPLVFPRASFGHLAVELESEPVRVFYEALASRFTLIRYDRLGTGLSDRVRPPESLTLEFEVDVLATLIDELEIDRTHLFGFSYGGVVAAALAARRPERVRRLLLYGAFADGAAVTSPAVLRSVTGLLRNDWQLGSRLLAEAFVPDADEQSSAHFVRLRRESCDGEMAAALLEMWSRADLRDVLGEITAPTLVLHRSEDRVVPIGLGRALAALIPTARFQALEGHFHLPWLGDREELLRSVGSFLGFTPPPLEEAEQGADPPVALTAREIEVLRLVAEGLNDSGIAQRLVLSSHTVHRHVANIRTRLGAPSRAAAAAYATRLGLI